MSVEGSIVQAACFTNYSPRPTLWSMPRQSACVSRAGMTSYYFSVVWHCQTALILWGCVLSGVSSRDIPISVHQIYEVLSNTILSTRDVCLVY